MNYLQCKTFFSNVCVVLFGQSPGAEGRHLWWQCPESEKKESPVPTKCLVLHGIILQQLGRQVNSTHISVICYNRSWAGDIFHCPVHSGFDGPSDSMPWKGLLNCGAYKQCSYVHPLHKKKRVLSDPSDWSPGRFLVQSILPVLGEAFPVVSICPSVKCACTKSVKSLELV